MVLKGDTFEKKVSSPVTKVTFGPKRWHFFLSSNFDTNSIIEKVSPFVGKISSWSYKNEGNYISTGKKCHLLGPNVIFMTGDDTFFPKVLPFKIMIIIQDLAFFNQRWHF